MKVRMMALALVVAGCAALGMVAVSAHAAAPTGHFTDPGDGTVLDNLTGLHWQKGFAVDAMSRDSARSVCTTMGAGWRLPTILELRSIVDESVYNPSIDPVFTTAPLAHFWSDSSVAGSTTNGWSIDFYIGNASSDAFTSLNSVRCVH